MDPSSYVKAEINAGLTLLQSPSGLKFGTDALLLAAYLGKGAEVACELGAGTGAVSMLAVRTGRTKKVYAYEIQREFADLSRLNIRNNGLENDISVITGDIRLSSPSDTGGECDMVFTNPPYMPSGSGIYSPDNEKNIAKKEIFGTASDFCSAAGRLLRTGGEFDCVYRPDLLSGLLSSMSDAGIEPKRITFVHPSQTKPASLVLIRGRKGGKKGLTVTSPLFIYTSDGSGNHTEEYAGIYAGLTFEGII